MSDSLFSKAGKCTSQGQQTAPFSDGKNFKLLLPSWKRSQDQTRKKEILSQERETETVVLIPQQGRYSQNSCQTNGNQFSNTTVHIKVELCAGNDCENNGQKEEKKAKL